MEANWFTDLRNILLPFCTLCQRFKAFGNPSQHDVDNPLLHSMSLELLEYRKRPSISCTFSHKIKAQNQGCGLSTDISVFGVLKHPN